MFIFMVIFDHSFICCTSFANEQSCIDCLKVLKRCTKCTRKGYMFFNCKSNMLCSHCNHGSHSVLVCVFKNLNLLTHNKVLILLVVIQIFFFCKLKSNSVSQGHSLSQVQSPLDDNDIVIINETSLTSVLILNLNSSSCQSALKCICTKVFNPYNKSILANAFVLLYDSSISTYFKS